MDLSTYGGAIGDEIVLRARDDFEVSSAQVEITYADGNPVESGAAVETPAKSGRWVYTASAAATADADARIAVTVKDRPGGRGRAAWKVNSFSIPVGTRSQIPIQHFQIHRQAAQLFHLCLRRRGDAAARKNGMMRLPTIPTFGQGCQDFGRFLLD